MEIYVEEIYTEVSISVITIFSKNIPAELNLGQSGFVQSASCCMVRDGAACRRENLTTFTTTGAGLLRTIIVEAFLDEGQARSVSCMSLLGESNTQCSEAKTNQKLTC